MEQDLEDKINSDALFKLNIKHAIAWASLPITLWTQAAATFMSSTPSGLEPYVSAMGGGYITLLSLAVGWPMIIRGSRIMFSGERKNHDERRLVTGDIYSSVRHPIYLGFRVISMGSAFYNPSVENLILTSMVFTTTELTARVEEKKMKVLYSREYNEYAARVPRWVPKLSDVWTFFNEIKKYASSIKRNSSI